jgi:hypothetical protein
MRGRLAGAALALCCALAGCGGSTGDLMGISVRGGPVRGTERLRVTLDGRGSCNAGKLASLPSERVLDARNVERDSRPLVKAGASFGQLSRGRRNFELKTKDGNVTWVDGSPGLPAVLSRAELLALELERLLCNR